jgi:dCMP deaminase
MVKPSENKRISKADMYLNCAENFAYRSTCLKRKYGAVIVKDDVVISTGYNGSPRGYENCCDIGTCPRIKRNMHQGEGYGMCRAIHAEANALLNCSREQTIGADLYLSCVNPGNHSVHRAKPCPLCARQIIQAGINNVVLRIGEGEDDYEIIPAKNLEWYTKAEDEGE